MTNDHTPEPVEQVEEPKATKAKAPAKPKRVTMRNTKAGNGEIGGIATPLAEDVPVWEKRGWVRA